MQTSAASLDACASYVARHIYDYFMSSTYTPTRTHPNFVEVDLDYEAAAMLRLMIFTTVVSPILISSVISVFILCGGYTASQRRTLKYPLALVVISIYVPLSVYCGAVSTILSCANDIGIGLMTFLKEVLDFYVEACAAATRSSYFPEALSHIAVAVFGYVCCSWSPESTILLRPSHMSNVAERSIAVQANAMPTAMAIGNDSVHLEAHESATAPNNAANDVSVIRLNESSSGELPMPGELVGSFVPTGEDVNSLDSDPTNHPRISGVIHRGSHLDVASQHDVALGPAPPAENTSSQVRMTWALRWLVPILSGYNALPQLAQLTRLIFPGRNARTTQAVEESANQGPTTANLNHSTHGEANNLRALHVRRRVFGNIFAPAQGTTGNVVVLASTNVTVQPARNTPIGNAVGPFGIRNGTANSINMNVLTHHSRHNPTILTSGAHDTLGFATQNDSQDGMDVDSISEPTGHSDVGHETSVPVIPTAEMNRAPTFQERPPHRRWLDQPIQRPPSYIFPVEESVARPPSRQTRQSNVINVSSPGPQRVLPSDRNAERTGRTEPTIDVCEGPPPPEVVRRRSDVLVNGVVKCTNLTFINEGRTAEVWRAEDVSYTSNRIVALKCFKPDSLPQGRDEVQLCQYLHEQNQSRHRIPELFGVINQRNQVVMAMELMNHDLYELMCGLDSKNLTLVAEDFKVITFQLTDVINWLHTLGYCHCDIKPENIAIKSTEGKIVNTFYGRRYKLKSTRVCLIDFGAAVSATEARRTLRVGTKYYSAPEVLLGLFWSLPRDAWGLAMTLLQLVFPPDSTSQRLRAGSPEHLKWIDIALGPIPGYMLETARAYAEENGSTPLHDQLFTWNDAYYASASRVRDMLFRNVNLENQRLQSFIRNLLVPDPLKRMTIRQALHHEYISDLAAIGIERLG